MKTVKDREAWRTAVECPPAPGRIDYTTAVVVMGSCFAKNVGARMQRAKLNVTVNPFGTVFHPLPAAACMERMMTGKPYRKNELQWHRELWCSFDHHGSFSHGNAKECLKKINGELEAANVLLRRARLLFVTFGTAWAYRIRETGKYAVNCHSYPAAYFDRVRTEADEIFAVWSDTLMRLRVYNPRVRVVFTVSPVRHLRDGAHENQLSKSALLLAVDRLVREIEYAEYFPAYEIVLDELRDYRFYADDMMHPSTVAVDYIWQRFCESYMLGAAMPVMHAVEDVVTAAGHRPMHRTTYVRDFAYKYLDMIDGLKQQVRHLDFSREREIFEGMLEDGA